VRDAAHSHQQKVKHDFDRKVRKKEFKIDVSDNFCLGHKSTQVGRLHVKCPSAAWENLFF
jgi:hypothetical protein